MKPGRLSGLPDETEIIVIGGGATGLGTAVDAAARGHQVVLLEQSDFAKGTSSRSTKLIHGGLRYLKQGNIPLVLEALQERGILCRNAPHLVKPLGFIIPLHGFWDRPMYEAGLRLYDILAGSLGLEKMKHLGREQALEQLPGLQSGGLRGAMKYWDAQFDDARLAITLLRTFEKLGGHALNYAPAAGLLKQNGRIIGVRCEDAMGEGTKEIRARVVINATGVFCDAIRQLDEPDAEPMIAASQGAHVVLPRSFLPGKAALMVPKTPDGRVLFAVPWLDHLVVGTTDLPVQRIDLEPRPMEKEIDFILETAGRYLERKPQRSDVLSTFAGLRPLVRKPGAGKTAEIPRNHTIIVSDSGMITVTGGKWTTFRRMGEEVVDRAQKAAGLPGRACESRDLPLHGAAAASAGPLEEYGSEAGAVAALASHEPGLDRRLHPDLPAIGAQVRWAVEQERALTVEDVLARRTRSLFLNARAAAASAPGVAAIMAPLLGWTKQQQQEQVQTFGRLAAAYQID